MFTNLVSAFVSPWEGSYIFLRCLGDLAGQRIDVRQMVICAVPVKWLRCTNKTDDAESRDAYHPLRGCLTAGVAAGHVPPRLHTYRTNFLQPCTFLWCFWCFCRQRGQHVYVLLSSSHSFSSAASWFVPGEWLVILCPLGDIQRQHKSSLWYRGVIKPLC